MDKHVLEINVDGLLVRDIAFPWPKPSQAVKPTNDYGGLRSTVVYDRCSGEQICMVNRVGLLMASCHNALSDSFTQTLTAQEEFYIISQWTKRINVIFAMAD